MKKLILFLIICMSSLLLDGQTPNGFNYQAVARDVNGSPIANANIPVKIGILSDTTLNTYVWEEQHSAKTNSAGLISLVVGTGTRVQGLASFSNIDWSGSPLFIRVKITYGGTERTMGSSRIWSVPYAKATDKATNADNAISANTAVTANTADVAKVADSSKVAAVAYGVSNGVKLSVVSDDDLGTDALFEVKRKDGQTVFAVYPDAVNVYVNNTAKGAKGGFAIGGFDGAKGTSQDYFRVTPDSTRIYVPNPPAAVKGAKGGFAIGGFDGAKGITHDLLTVHPDSTRIYVKESAKGAKGGFAIGGFSEAKGELGSFMNLTPENYFIGQDAGKSITSGLYNSFIGFEAGKANSTGAKNAFIGYQSGISNIGGSDNIFIGSNVGGANSSGFKNVYLGNDAGKNNLSGSNNIFIGYQAGYLGSHGGQNIAIGNYAGFNNATGQNLFIGEYAGEQTTTGTRNSFVGFFAGQENVSGELNSYFGQFAGMNNTKSRNTMIGYWAGGNNVDGQYNVFLGWRAGQGSNGSNNVFLGYQAGEGNGGANNVLIGYQAGMFSGNVSNVLYIDNSSVATPLIWGDFNLNRLRFNGNTSINSAPSQYYALKIDLDADDTYGLVVYGQAYCSSGSWSASDFRLKKNVLPLNDALSSVLKMEGVSFDWKSDEFKDMGFSKTRQVGLIAQDVEKIIPELVNEGPDGYKSIDYTKLGPILIEAIKEQQKMIDDLRSEIELLKNKN